MESKSSPRLDWLDIAKGITAFFVILGHTVSHESVFRGLIFSFHMPLFFILAGYTFRKKEWRGLLESSFTRLVIPYLLMVLVWNVPHYLMSTETLNFNGVTQVALTAFFASGTLVPRTNIAAVGMSWFLMALFFARLIFNAVIRISEKTRNPHVWSFCICLSFFLAGKTIGSVFKIYLPFSIDVSLVGTLFMWGGYFIKTRANCLVSSSPLAGAISCIIWLFTASHSSLEMAARIYTPSILSLIAAFSGTYLICWISMQVSKLKNFKVLHPVYKGFLYCGRNSMGIYCFHALDWWIPWSSLSAFSGMPFSNLLKSVLRFIYSVSYCKLTSLIR